MSDRRVVQLSGGFRVECVGESFYVDALREIAGAGADKFGPMLRWASLVPEPGNPYDPHAVAVHIEGKKVGHLDRATAALFQPAAARIIATGCDAQCAAVIVGGGGKKIFGVVLDLAAPEKILEELGE